MGFDLTESELKATRKLHGLDKEENIEEDIEKIKQLNNLLKFFRTHGWIPNMSREINTNGTIEAIENILSEREQDKKRIEELEEKNKHLKYVYDDCCKCLLDTIEKQKVKDKIEELKKEYEIALEENSTKAFILKCKISALEELLEDK